MHSEWIGYVAKHGRMRSQAEKNEECNGTPSHWNLRSIGARYVVTKHQCCR